MTEHPGKLGGICSSEYGQGNQAIISHTIPSMGSGKESVVLGERTCVIYKILSSSDTHVLTDPKEKGRQLG